MTICLHFCCPCEEARRKVWGQENREAFLVAGLDLSGKMELNEQICKMLGTSEVQGWVNKGERLDRKLDEGRLL